MRPLNGRCGMTRDEINARRRELNRNPFHKALDLKVKKKWREANKDKLNARQREWYAANREKCIERQKKWRAENLDKARESWKKWAGKNREKLRERDRVRRLNPELVEHARKLRKLRDSSPEGRAKNRAAKRNWYATHKDKASVLRWTLCSLWIPRWKKLEFEGPEAEDRYLRR